MLCPYFFLLTAREIRAHARAGFSRAGAGCRLDPKRLKARISYVNLPQSENQIRPDAVDRIINQDAVKINSCS